MNITDIILIVVLLYAAYKGFCNGLVIELCGILGVIVGAYLAYKFAWQLAEWLSLSDTVGYVVSFVLLLLVALLAIGIAARIASHVLRFTGFGTLNSLLGAAASVLKVALIAGIVLSYLDKFSTEEGPIDRKYIAESKLYGYFEGLSDAVFPYLGSVRHYYREVKRDLENEAGRKKPEENGKVPEKTVAEPQEGGADA